MGGGVGGLEGDESGESFGGRVELVRDASWLLTMKLSFFERLNESFSLGDSTISD